EQIPLWHHTGFIAGRQKRYGSKVYKCLMNNHNVEMADEAAKVASRLDEQGHRSRKDCKCAECKTDRENKGCINPHKCVIAVKEVLDCLIDKWDP
ncbi:hypothetical protein ARMGADRAFT_945086, partial [Armillaria gallica]